MPSLALSAAEEARIQTLSHVVDVGSRAPSSRSNSALHEFSELSSLVRNLQKNNITLKQEEYCKEQYGIGREFWPEMNAQAIRLKLRAMQEQMSKTLETVGKIVGTNLVFTLNFSLTEKETKYWENAFASNNVSKSHREIFEGPLKKTNELLRKLNAISTEPNAWDVMPINEFEEKGHLEIRRKVIANSIADLSHYLQFFEELLFKRNRSDSCYVDANQLLRYAALYIERIQRMHLAWSSLSNPQNPGEHLLFSYAASEHRSLLYSHNLSLYFNRVCTLVPKGTYLKEEMTLIKELSDMVGHVDRYPVSPQGTAIEGNLKGTIAERLEVIKTYDEFYYSMVHQGGFATELQQRRFSYLNKEAAEKGMKVDFSFVSTRIEELLNNEIYTRVKIALNLGYKLLSLFLQM